MSRPSTARRASAAAAAVLVLLTSACSSDEPSAAAPQVVPTSRAVVPEGWTVQRGPGLSVATPVEWVPRPDDLRLAPDAALEVGVPYVGQPVALPLLLGFVEREQVGPLDVREKLVRLQLEQGLPEGATLGARRRVEVAGSTDAVSFDAVYSTPAGTSVLDTPVAAVTVRQRELLVETPGLPKYGLRLTAPVDDFDEQLWEDLVGSLVVTAGGPGPTDPASPAA